MNNDFLKYTCLFGGGAMRGTAYIGTIRALEEIGIRPQNIAGSSVGAIIATLWALGYTSEDMKSELLNFNFELFKDFHFGIGSRFALSKGEVFLDWTRELIEKKYYGNKYRKGKNKAVTFNDIDKNLTIIATDLTNFKCYEFSKIETPEYEIATAIRISCTMPGLMKPITYKDRVLVDGDLQKSIPMWKLSKNLQNNNERIIEFRLEGDTLSPDKKRNTINYINTVYSCITSICTDYISQTYGNKDEYDYITINTGNVIVVDFNCSKEIREQLIESGYQQTINYFKNKLPLKKESLLKNYYVLEQHLKKISKLVHKKRIIKAKDALGDLFIDLCEQMEVIDENILQRIKCFKNLFIKNIHYPALFGNAKLKEEELVNNELNEILSHITNKIYEIESYLVKYHI